jgi:lysozyme family protein
MRQFDEYFDIILKHEGGFSDHSADPGGATKYGISLVFLKGLTLDEGDINNDGVIDRNDIIGLTIDDSKILYQKHFWNPLNIDNISNELLKLHLFDHGVNAGTRTAVKLLQRILKLNDDGVIGTITTTSANSYNGDIIDEYKKARQNYYLAIIEKNPKLEVFKNGWFNRINSTIFE